MALLKKSANVIFMAFLGVVIIFFIVKFNPIKHEGIQVEYKPPKNNDLSGRILESHSFSERSPGKAKENVRDAKESETYAIRRNPIAMKEIKEWFASRGNYNFEDPTVQDDYKNYDLVTLKKLSEAGDVRAMQQLIERSSDLDEKVNLAHRAILYGSTAAIERIGFIVEDKSRLQQNSLEERKRNVTEILSYFEAAKLRGDELVNIFSGDDLLRRYPTDLTQEDRVYIKKRAKDIYDDFQKSRIEAGLGEYDNSVPQAVNDYYKEIIGADCDKALHSQSSKIYCE